MTWVGSPQNKYNLGYPFRDYSTYHNLTRGNMDHLPLKLTSNPYPKPN